MKTRILMAVLLVALVQTACGSGGDGGGAPVASDSVPPSAGATPASFFAYLMVMMAGSSETSEGLKLDGVNEPVDEVSEPSVVAA